MVVVVFGGAGYGSNLYHCFFLHLLSEFGQHESMTDSEDSMVLYSLAAVRASFQFGMSGWSQF